MAAQWKYLNARKLLYLTHLLNLREKWILGLLLAVSLISGAVFFGRVYAKITTEVPAVGKTYTEGLFKDPRTINPVYASQDTDRDIARLIFSSILTYIGEGTLELDVAENIDASEDGKTYTIDLKKNVQWHDGKPLNADDILFTIKRVQNPLYQSPLRANWQGVEAEKIDDWKIRFSLRTPYPAFLENLTLGILPRHLWEEIAPEQALLHELNLKPIGSGPYQFDRLKQNTDGSIAWYRVSRNKAYYREGPYLKTITFSFFKNEDQMIASWRRGDIEGFGPVSITRIPELNQNRSKILEIQMPRIFGLFFNEKQGKLLQPKKIRLAIAHAINKDEVASEIAAGAIVADHPLPFLVDTHLTGSVMYDPDTSRRLLEEEGWNDADGDSIREKKIIENKLSVTKPLRFTLVTSDWPDLIKTAELIKTRLREVGIDIAIEKYPFSELESSIIRPRNFEILLFGQVYGYEPDPFTFWHSSQIKDPGLNVSLYTNKNADRLLEDARKSQDAALRDKKYQEFSKLIHDDVPAIFLFSQLYLYLIPADLGGAHIEKISLPADRFNEINRWYRTTDRVFK